MNIKRLLICLIVMLPISAKADQLTVMFGGWSDHQLLLKSDSWNGDGSICRRNNRFNENHNIWGLEYKNIIIATFKNSCYNRGGLLAYKKRIVGYKNNHIRFRFNIAVGLVSGYNNHNIMGSKISPYLLPEIESTVKITDNYYLALSTGFIPDDRGFVILNSLKLIINF